MGVRWNPLGFRLPFYLVLILVLQIPGCWALNPEGLALLEFRAGVYNDPQGAFKNWDPNDSDPCSWLGVYCVDGVVEILNLTGFSLEGRLLLDLGKLFHLKSLILSKNKFLGDIPKEIGDLSELELLDLRDNSLSGTIPAEIGRIQSLKRLFLCGNMFEGSVPEEIQRLSCLSLLQFDENLTSSQADGAESVTRKYGRCIWQNRLKQPRKVESFISLITEALLRFRFFGHGYESNCCGYTDESEESNMVQNELTEINHLRRKLAEQSSNLAAIPVDSKSLPPVTNVMVTRSSGSFPAVPSKNTTESNAPSASPPAGGSAGNAGPPVPVGSTDYSTNDDVNTWKYLLILIPSIMVLIFIVAAMLLLCRKQGVATIGPWKTGLSGQLQKAFVTGVPKLNRPELETACEDFSNIISTLDGSIVYKGTLSSGVEIAVTSTSVSSIKDWSNTVEKAYRKRIDMLSRVNHKNFVNLLGYCEEDAPFTRMMVFEYAPNGTLFEHLHVKEAEHLDWNARVRIVMGVAYCLQYMHHDINPPVAHSNVNSMVIMLTDDYAAKVAEVNIWSGASSKPRSGEDDKSESSELPPLTDPETNVYDFGVLLLEIVSGKLPYSEEQGAILDWAAQYLNDTKALTYLIDPTLKSFKNNELDVICEVIQDCIKSDTRQRPTMQEVTSKLRKVINISPDQATPKLSPLWWAELEILSAEAT